MAFPLWIFLRSATKAKPNTLSEEGMHQVGDQWFNDKGDNITKKVNSFGTGPIKEPSYWQRLVNPEEATLADRINTQYAINPIEARQKEQLDIEEGVRNARQYLSFADPNKYPTPDSVPEDLARKAFAAMGKTVGPTRMGIERRSIAQNVSGQPEKESELTGLKTDFDIQQARGMLNRQPVQEAIFDKQAINELSTVLSIDPKKIQLEINDLAARLKRQPSELELVKRLLSLQTRQMGTKEELQKVIEDTQPLTSSTERLKATGENIAAQYPFGMNPLNPKAFRMSPTGEMITEKNPLFMSTYDRTMAMMDELNQGKGGGAPIQLNNGTVIVPDAVPETPNFARPLVAPTGVPVVAPPAATITNATPAATNAFIAPNPAMAQSAVTTNRIAPTGIPQFLQSSMSAAEQRNKRSAISQQLLDMLKPVEEKQYMGVPVFSRLGSVGRAFNSEIDPQMVLDFLASPNSTNYFDKDAYRKAMRLFQQATQ